MANFYFLNTGDNSWSNVNNWSNTDGGTPVGSLPTINDDVFLTALSGDCTQNTGVAQSIKTFTCVGYVNTLSLTIAASPINVYGNIIFGNQMKIVSTTVPILLAANASVTSNGIAVPRFSLGLNALTVTLLDQLNISNVLNMTSSRDFVWAGNFGWNTKKLFITNAAGNTVTFKAGNTYIVNDTFTYTSEKGSAHGKVISSTPGTKAILTVTGDTNIGYVDFTDIDASGGRTLYPFNGVVTNCNNIIQLVDKSQFTDLTVESSSII
jgi:hypothetical protein